MRKAIAPLVLAVLILSVSANASQTVFTPHMPEPSTLIKGYCPKVVDGDTIYIEITEDGIPVAHTYRLIGVDTPETVHPDKGAEPYGAEAFTFTSAMVLNKWVYVEYDIERKDDYDRHPGYIWLEDGTLFNQVLLERGYGEFLVIAPNVKYSSFFIYAQKAAKSAGLGIWSPIPNIVLSVDLESLTTAELMLLQKRIAEELSNR